MKRLKTLLPSLKERKRYLVFEIESETDFSDFKIISKAVKSNILKFLGEFSAAKAGIKILPNTWTGNKCIIKINNKYVDQVKSALTLIETIDNNKIIFKNIGVSGTIKGTERFMAS